MDFSGKHPVSRPAARETGFDEVARMLLANGVEVCKYLLPGGRVSGAYYLASDLRGGNGMSLSVNLQQGGVWKDWATSDSGSDLISLWAAVHHVPQGEAKKLAERWLGIEAPAQPVSRLEPSPAREPDDSDPNWWRGERHARKWEYVNADGSFFMEVYRWEAPGRQKVIRPWDGSQYQAPPAPRPIYRLPEVMSHDGFVVVVEGEKAADAIVEAGYCGTTCWGGANAIKQTDWSALASKDVVLWPDNDAAGRAWTDTLTAALRDAGAASIRIIR